MKLITPPITCCYLFYSEMQPIYKTMVNENLVDRLVEGVPDYDSLRQLLKSLKQKGHTHTLLIMDDSREYFSQLEPLYTIASHHLGASVITLTQSLFSKNESLRVLSMNSKYLICMKSVRSNRSITTLGSQLSVFDKGQVVSAFEEISRNPYGYLIIDLGNDCADHCRLRTFIFKHESLCPICFLQSK